MFTLAAFGQSVDLGGVLTPINAVPDPHLTVNGINLRVPAELPNLLAALVLSTTVGAARAQLASPSLRREVLFDLTPKTNIKVVNNVIPFQNLRDNPYPLAAMEDLNYQEDSDPVGATQQTCLVWFCDGAIKPVSGPIFSLRCTSAVALAANTWVNGPLVFSQVLPVGKYQIVGMRAEGTNLIAARLVIPGYAWRPGVFGIINPVSQMIGDFQAGRMGIFGEFDSLTPPTVDCLGDTDGAQTYILDLIPVG